MMWVWGGSAWPMLQGSLPAKVLVIQAGRQRVTLSNPGGWVYIWSMLPACGSLIDSHAGGETTRGLASILL